MMVLSSLLRIALFSQALRATAGAFTSTEPVRTSHHAASTTTTTTTTQLHEQTTPRIYSKRRARVVLDPKTGFYRPEPKKPLEGRVAKKGRKKGPGAWDSFKDAVYGGIDSLGKIPRLIGNDDEEAGSVTDGYEQIQKRVYGSSSPGKRLLEEYQQRGGLTPTEEENTQRSGNSVFDSVKGVFYRTVDAAGELASGKANEDAQMDSGVPSSSFKPVVRSTLGTSDEVQASLSDLNSKNPVRKLIAERKIRDFENKEREAEKAIRRYERSRKAKEIVYKVSDAAQVTVDGLAKVPQKVAGSYEQTKKFLVSISTQARRTADAVVSIPSKVQQKTEEIQKTVDSSIKTTKQAVEKVQSIPAKVKESADNVKQTVKKTSDTITAAADAVDETVLKTKILVGLEKDAKLKPRPPDLPPPKPLTASEIGWKVAGGVASTGAKLAWWTGKSAAFLTYKGAKLAIEKGQETLREKQLKSGKAESPPPSSSSVSTGTGKAPSPPKTEPPPVPTAATVKIIEPDSVSATPDKINQKAVADRGNQEAPSPKKDKEDEREKKVVGEYEKNEDLDRQVSEALLLAEEALKKTSSASSPSNKQETED